MTDGKKSCDCLNNVACEVSHCKYNEIERGACTAKNIKVQNRAAVDKRATFCDTFAPKASV